VLGDTDPKMDESEGDDPETDLAGYQRIEKGL
jgi:hypothetical protein